MFATFIVNKKIVKISGYSEAICKVFILLSRKVSICTGEIFDDTEGKGR